MRKRNVSFTDTSSTGKSSKSGNDNDDDDDDDDDNDSNAIATTAAAAAILTPIRQSYESYGLFARFVSSQFSRSPSRHVAWPPSLIVTYLFNGLLEKRLLENTVYVKNT